MAINPLLALRTQSLDTATPVRNLINMKVQSEQLGRQRRQEKREEKIASLREKKLSGEIIRDAVEAKDAREQRRIRQAAEEAMRIKGAVESGGPEKGMSYLEKLKGKPGGLEDEDVERMRGLLESGDTETLTTTLDNNIYIGEALGVIETPDQPAQFETIVDDEGNPIAQRETTSGKIISDPRAPDDPSTQVDVTTNVGGDKYNEVQAKNRAERMNQLVTTGRGAVTTEQNLNQMADLLTSGVQTGAAQPAITSLQALAEDFGLDLSSVADRVGIENLSNLGGREEFDRLAKQTIIEGFEKFKGNLNDREVKLAMDAFANLGKSEEGNLRAIASLKAAQALAKDRGLRASQVTSEAEARALEQELFEGSQERFETLRQEFEKELRDRMPDEQAGPTRERAGQQGGNIELDPETQSLLEKYQ